MSVETDRSFWGELTTAPLELTRVEKRRAAVRTADYAHRNAITTAGVLELLAALGIRPDDIRRAR